METTRFDIVVAATSNRGIGKDGMLLRVAFIKVAK